MGISTLTLLEYLHLINVYLGLILSLIFYIYPEYYNNYGSDKWNGSYFKTAGRNSSFSNWMNTLISRLDELLVGLESCEEELTLAVL